MGSGKIFGLESTEILILKIDQGRIRENFRSQGIAYRKYFQQAERRRKRPYLDQF
jgi:hypothetical protein